MPLFDNLMQPNATVRIEQRTTARDSSGGSTETWAIVATNVSVLVSGISGGRDGRFDGKNNTLRGTCTGENAYLGYTNIRLYFLTGQLAGLYGHSDSVDQHGPNVDTLIDGSWYSVRFSVYQTR